MISYNTLKDLESGSTVSDVLSCYLRVEKKDIIKFINSSNLQWLKHIANLNGKTRTEVSAMIAASLDDIADFKIEDRYNWIACTRLWINRFGILIDLKWDVVDWVVNPVTETV